MPESNEVQMTSDEVYVYWKPGRENPEPMTLMTALGILSHHKHLGLGNWQWCDTADSFKRGSTRTVMAYPVGVEGNLDDFLIPEDEAISIAQEYVAGRAV